MARTPLMGQIEQIAAEVAAEHGSPTTTRRDFLRGAGAAGAVGAASLILPGGLRSSAKAAGPPPRIVIVGAGLAGLTAAYRLKQAGYNAQVHEASTRVGGRCWTLRGAFLEGQIAEHGGELIDTGHLEIKHLAQEFGLTLDNLFQAQQNGTEDIYRFDGVPYTYAEATNDIKAIWQQVHKDVVDAGYPTTYLSSTERGRQLDRMTIAQWVAAYVPGGRSSRLGQLLEVAYNIEYGAETDGQSALNMLYLLGYAGQGQLRVFGRSNEKQHVHGGNDQIPTLLAASLTGQITIGSELTAIAQNSNGSYGLDRKSVV